MPDYHVVRTQNMKAAYYATEHILDTISITIAAPDCTCLNLDSRAANPAMHATPVHTLVPQIYGRFG